MSIIYEALKKVEGKDKSSSAQEPVKSGKFVTKEKQKVVYRPKRHIFFPAMSLIVISGLIVLLISLINQKEGPLKLKIFSSNFLKRQSFNKSTPAGYNLEGIIYEEGSAFAIINGKSVKESDRIDSFLVSEIFEDKVEMINPDNNSKLTPLFQ